MNAVNGDTVGVMVNLPSGAVWVHESLSLGDILISSLLLLILLVLILRWVFDVVY